MLTFVINFFLLQILNFTYFGQMERERHERELRLHHHEAVERQHHHHPHAQQQQQLDDSRLHRRHRDIQDLKRHLPLLEDRDIAEDNDEEEEEDERGVSPPPSKRMVEAGPSPSPSPPTLSAPSAAAQQLQAVAAANNNIAPAAEIPSMGAAATNIKITSRGELQLSIISLLNYYNYYMSKNAIENG